MSLIRNLVKIKEDTNGNPRYVIHFLDIPAVQRYFDKLKGEKKPQSGKTTIKINHAGRVRSKTFEHKTNIDNAYQYACFLMSVHLGGKKYNTKNYAGGIVFQSYNIYSTLSIILDL